MSERFQIAVIGSGPSGLSCAARAAELGISHVLLEARPHPCDTIHRYQKGKHVMAEPAVLGLRSPLPFEAGSRETVLDAWTLALNERAINLRTDARVHSITGSKGDFEIRARSAGAPAAEQVYRAEHVVLCIGVQGNLRGLEVPGDELAQYELEDPDAYVDETIMVVGAGDAAVENALALARRNRVVLLNRKREFARLQPRNLELVLEAIQAKQLECYYETEVRRLATDGARISVVVKSARDADDTVLECDRIIARLGAAPPRDLIEGFGVRFAGDDPDAVPELSETYESNIPGLYIIGALGGYPLIKWAMNQGYEVVEYIRGNMIEPMDEPLLKAKFRRFGRGLKVSEALQAVRRDVPLFADLTTLQLREFLLSSEVHAPARGELVFRKDDRTDSFFTILQGEVVVETDIREGGGRNVRRQGEFFGELGLISGRARTASVRAGRDCVLIETPRRSMLKLLNSKPAVRTQVDRQFMRRALQVIFMDALPAPAVEELVTHATVRKFNKDAVLFSEGDEPDGLHLIRRGSVRITQGGIRVASASAGDYVGEMALLRGGRRSATVRAAVTTETTLLPLHAFNEILARYPELNRAIEGVILSRTQLRAREQSQPELYERLAWSDEEGLSVATNALVIDETLCVRCDYCEKACAETHGGIARFVRAAGPTHMNIHLPTACRHCDDAPCLDVECPPNAIQRTASGAVIVADTCIACGNCAASCPYDAIEIVEVKPKVTQWLASLGRPKSRTLAVKCDVCADVSGGPACVRACPTGAALRLDPRQDLYGRT